MVRRSDGQALVKILDGPGPWGRAVLISVARGKETTVKAENWHEERDRLVLLLKAIEAGKVTHIDEDDLRQLQATNPVNIALLKERLDELNARLGDRTA